MFSSKLLKQYNLTKQRKLDLLQRHFRKFEKVTFKKFESLMMKHELFSRDLFMF